MWQLISRKVIKFKKVNAHKKNKIPNHNYKIEYKFTNIFFIKLLLTVLPIKRYDKVLELSGERISSKSEGRISYFSTKKQINKNVWNS